ncbi:methyl-accepting chemotaxis protein [Paenibacillus fonticola]|uniref:methyl-accepting chemotaxis protein n=1 Tax=Paenibacillus fonticola TaxID=379896 RepID=UPI0003692DD9|nr:methyl-accepting chemotaxis protein [Paenibacillus fonticola]
MKWFYNLKTAVKLISSFVVIAIIVTFVGFFGLNNMDRLNKSVNEMYDLRLLPITNVMDMQITYQRLRNYVLNLYLAPTQQEKDENLSQMEQFRKEIDARIAEYGKRTFNTTEHEELYKKVEPSWLRFEKAVDEAVQLSMTGSNDQFIAFLHGEYKESRDEFNTNLENLISFNTRQAEQASIDTDVLYASSRTTTIVIIIAALLLSIGFGYLISQVIARPLNRVARLVGKVANGDLTETEDINTKDEVGQVAASINDMVLSLRETVGSILTSAESVSAAAEQISASTEEIASGSTSQANDAQMMNELFRELSLAISSVARSAEEASELSNQTLTIAQDGGEVVRSSIVGMNQVNEQMALLEEDSNKIGEIIEVIDDIADQTNLLALNAAIEAARAGDQGRGFAVVADEVRKLAERSSEATKQITSIIKGMQQNTQHSVRAVEEGVNSTQKTGEAFEHIMAMVSDSAQKVAEIAAASEEQAAQSSDVLASIESISAATEESAASSEETASTAQSLAELAEELNQSVATFKVN